MNVVRCWLIVHRDDIDRDCHDGAGIRASIVRAAIVHQLNGNHRLAIGILSGGKRQIPRRRIHRARTLSCRGLGDRPGCA